MKKIIVLNLATIATLLAMICIAFYLLIQDTIFHISISSIIAKTQNLAQSKHLIALGLLPIYIALVIFGAALLGIYFGSMIQQYLIRARKKPVLLHKRAY